MGLHRDGLQRDHGLHGRLSLTLAHRQAQARQRRVDGVAGTAGDQRSGAHVLVVGDVAETNISNILARINEISLLNTAQMVA